MARPALVRSDVVVGIETAGPYERRVLLEVCLDALVGVVAVDEQEARALPRRRSRTDQTVFGRGMAGRSSLTLAASGKSAL